jgi:hypothetical protein
MPDYSLAENSLGWGSSQANETTLDVQVAGQRNVLLGVREQVARQETAEVELVDTSGPSAAAGIAPAAVEPNVPPHRFLGQWAAAFRRRQLRKPGC